jgi:hypothetical protein
MSECDSEATIADPACGGGQFLLVAFTELVRRGAAPESALTQLSGRDLDPTAVDAARRGLARAAEARGVSRERARELCAAAVVCGDGLDVAADSVDVVATNPPYIGHRAMPTELSDRLKRDFRPFHLDLSAAFIDRCVGAARRSVAILSQQNIWYLSRFEAARRALLDRYELRLFAHFGAHLFGVLTGEKASVVGFVLQTDSRSESGVSDALFIDLRELSTPVAMREAVVSGTGESRRVDDVTRLPGAPVAHWLPERLLDVFESDVPKLGDVFDVPGSQNKTGRNREFVRSVHELRESHDVHDIAPLDAPASKGARWRYYSKGGRFAPWWGNWDWMVDWSERARAFYRDNRTSNLLDEAWVDRPGLVYTDFGGRTFNARFKPATALFDMAGPAIFHPDDDLDALYALVVYLNSEPARLILNALNPSLHYQVRDVRRLPLPGWSDHTELTELGRELVGKARAALEKPSAAAADALFRLEDVAHGLVCERYGVVPREALPRHHRLHELH